MNSVHVCVYKNFEVDVNYDYDDSAFQHETFNH